MVTWNPDHQGRKDLAIDNAPVEAVGRRFHVWSFWDEAYLGIRDKTHVFKDIEHYHGKLIRLTAVDPEGRPTLIGSNFHMSMAESEIKAVQATASDITVEMIPSAAAIEGQLVFYSEKPLCIADARGCRAFVMKSGDRAYTAVITERDRCGGEHRVSLVITFQEVPTLADIAQDVERHQQYRAGTMTLLR